MIEKQTSQVNGFALSTIESAWMGSRLKGKFFFPMESGQSTKIWCEPRDLVGNKPNSGVNVRVVGFDEINTPFGKTKNGMILSGDALGGLGPTQPANYSVGDVIVAVALIKADEGALPRMMVYDQGSQNLPEAGGNMTTGGVPVAPVMGGEWQLWAYVFPAARAGTGLKFRFSAGVADKSIQVASYGYNVIPVADLITTKFSGKKRAKCQIWTPFYFVPAELDSSSTFDWPALAAGAQQSTVVAMPGASVGDFATASMSVSLLGTSIWAEVTGTDAVTVYQRNGTAASVDVASGALKVRVRKLS
ncbi:hypothetical protein [Variovorax boronicumulans]|uniref:hypothetical protein n=1 Tax=Variovorax boronicumulans TaxID=436515 RepID=UPI0012FD04D7|nr:hypothetical protein [Variovorax boronicumulans]